jgi:hypothetical protein
VEERKMKTACSLVLVGVVCAVLGAGCSGASQADLNKVQEDAKAARAELAEVKGELAKVKEGLEKANTVPAHWEYKVIVTASDPSAEMNRLGAEGWEVVSVAVAARSAYPKKIDQTTGAVEVEFFSSSATIVFKRRS